VRSRLQIAQSSAGLLRIKHNFSFTPRNDAVQKKSQKKSAVNDLTEDLRLIREELKQKQLEYRNLVGELAEATALPGDKYMGFNREQRDIQRKLREIEPEINRLRQLEKIASYPFQKKTALGRNIDRLRRECGWSLDELATATELDKKAVLAHVNKGAKPRPSTLKAYAETFSEKLGRAVSVAEIMGDG